MELRKNQEEEKKKKSFGTERFKFLVKRNEAEKDFCWISRCSRKLEAQRYLLKRSVCRGRKLKGKRREMTFERERRLVILSTIGGEHTEVWLWQIHHYSSLSCNSSFSLAIYGYCCYGLNMDILHVWFMLIFGMTWFSCYCPIYYSSLLCQKAT